MPLSHDKMLLLDFRQNYAKDAIDQLGKKVTSVKTVLTFKKNELEFFQLTEQNLKERNRFNDVTHLSKIIIRGHCCKGSSVITSDYHDDLAQQQYINKNDLANKLLSNIDIYKNEITKLRKIIINNLHHDGKTKPITRNEITIIQNTIEELNRKIAEVEEIGNKEITDLEKLLKNR